jgi:hypothetical protein
MSILNPIPLLQGRGATMLSAEPDCLVLERPGEELTIRLEAVARVRAEGRAVAVELRAPAGAEPLVYRVEDVSEAAATLFAKGVTSLLPAPEDGEEIDGATLVVLRTRRPEHRRRFLRRIKWLALGCQGSMAALSTAAALADDMGTAIAMVPVGLLATAGFGVGGYLLGTWWHERRLVRHGVTVAAVEARPGVYLYQDGTGMQRVLVHGVDAVAVTVAYDAQDPTDVVALQIPFTRRLNAGLGAFLVFCALNAAALAVLFLVETFKDGVP